MILLLFLFVVDDDDDGVEDAMLLLLMVLLLLLMMMMMVFADGSSAQITLTLALISAKGFEYVRQQIRHLKRSCGHWGFQIRIWFCVQQVIFLVRN